MAHPRTARMAEEEAVIRPMEDMEARPTEEAAAMEATVAMAEVDMVEEVMARIVKRRPQEARRPTRPSKRGLAPAA